MVVNSITGPVDIDTDLGFAMLCPNCLARQSYYSGLAQMWFCTNCGEKFTSEISKLAEEE